MECKHLGSWEPDFRPANQRADCEHHIVFGDPFTVSQLLHRIELVAVIVHRVVNNLQTELPGCSPSQRVCVYLGVAGVAQSEPRAGVLYRLFAKIPRAIS